MIRIMRTRTLRALEEAVEAAERDAITYSTESEEHAQRASDARQELADAQRAAGILRRSLQDLQEAHQGRLDSLQRDLETAQRLTARLERELHADNRWLYVGTRNGVPKLARWNRQDAKAAVEAEPDAGSVWTEYREREQAMPGWAVYPVKMPARLPVPAQRTPETT